jgi:hypothetical protein
MFRTINFIYALFFITLVGGVLAFYLVGKEQNFIYAEDISYENQNIITQNQALQMVKNLPEVKDFFAQKEKMHQAPQIGVGANTAKDNLGVYWTVQVYVNMTDHNSTFAWYQVYVETGKIVNLSNDD